MGRCRIGPTWKHRLSNPYWRLYVNDRSGAAIRGPEGLFHIPADRVVLVPPWGQFSGQCSRSVDHFHLHFDAVHLRGDWLRAAGSMPILVPIAEGAKSLSERLPSGSLGDHASWLAAHALIAESLLAALEVLGAGFRESLASEEESRSRLGSVLTAIEDHLAVALPIPELATLSGLSTGAFTRLFTKLTGDSPAKYIRGRRVTLACELLLGGSTDIEGVAEACGFANRYHFTRIFTRLCGVSPGAYVRQLRSPEASSSQP